MLPVGIFVKSESVSEVNLRICGEKYYEKFKFFNFICFFKFWLRCS